MDMKNEALTLALWHFDTLALLRYLIPKQPIPEFQPLRQPAIDRALTETAVDTVADKGNGREVHGQHGFTVSREHSQLVNHHLLRLGGQEVIDELAGHGRICATAVHAHTLDIEVASFLEGAIGKVL